MSYGHPPPPVTGNLAIWAQNIVSYLQRTASRLAFRRSDARATENGVLLWDETGEYPIVSKNGAWRQVVLADGYAFLTRSTDVTAAATNTAYAIQYDAPVMADGVTLSGTNPTRIVFEEGGTFLLAFSAQLVSTTASTVEFRFWPRINGTDATGSTIRYNLKLNGSAVVVSRSAIFPMSAGDYLEVMWATDDTSGYLEASAATAYAPSAPATSLSITRIRA